MKTDALRKANNFPVKSALRGVTRKATESIESGDQAVAKELLVKVSSIADRAARKGIIHKNAAARKKSRLAKKLNKTQA